MAYLASHTRTESYRQQPSGGGRERQPQKRWPLAVILTAQAAFSLSLIGRPVVQDEATYIDAGNAEIAHWLHAAPTLQYPQFFSGAPVLYPPLSAAMAGAGGLIMTRLLSLCLMLATTALLWATARRLLGGWVPACAASLFAATAAVQYMGALATYDALALLLLAAASWCAVRAADRSGTRRYLLLAILCGLLLLANATKYASALWDPVVVAMAGLCEARRSGWRAGMITAAVTGLGTLLLLGVAALAGGSSYWKGIGFSTLNRTANGGTPASVILESSGRWIGVIALLALIGAIMLTQLTREVPVRALGWVLAAAAFLAPFDQARIGVIVSLFKHVGFGAWFAAIPAGYAVAVMLGAVASRLRRSSARVTVPRAAAVAVAVLAAIGVYEAQNESRLPGLYSQSAVARLRPLLQASRGPWLGDSPTVIIYYAHTSSLRWRNTYGFSYTEPHSGRRLTHTAAYVSAIHNHYFGIVVLRSGRMSIPVDRAIYRTLQQEPSYHLTVIPEEGGPQGPAKVLVWRLVRGLGQQTGAHHRSGLNVLDGNAAAAP